MAASPTSAAVARSRLCAVITAAIVAAAAPSREYTALLTATDGASPAHLATLARDGSVVSLGPQVDVGSDSVVTGTLRCDAAPQPRFCLFAALTNDAPGSRVYNVSVATGAVAWRRTFAGAVAAGVEWDAATASVLIALSGAGGKRLIALPPGQPTTAPHTLFAFPADDHSTVASGGSSLCVSPADGNRTFTLLLEPAGSSRGNMTLLQLAPPATPFANASFFASVLVNGASPMALGCGMVVYAPSSTGLPAMLQVAPDGSTLPVDVANSLPPGGVVELDNVAVWDDGAGVALGVALGGLLIEGNGTSVVWAASAGGKTNGYAVIGWYLAGLAPYPNTPMLPSSDSAAPPRAAVVWSAATTGDASLTVFDDDSYELAVRGEPWLISAPSRAALHLSQWYAVIVPPASSPPICSMLNDTDCRGNDLFNFSSTDPAACCASCANTTACGAWTWTGTTGDGALPPWAYQCYIKSSCAGRGPYSGHISGFAPAVSALPLTRLAAGPTADGGWQVTYAAATANETVEWVVSFHYNASADDFVFSQAFPGGASGMALVTAANASGSASTVGEFASSAVPTSLFPLWIQANTTGVAATLGFVSWQSRFFQAVGAPGVGAATALTVSAIGAEGGPVLLYDATASNASSRSALVWSPLGGYKSTIIGLSPLPGDAGLAAAGAGVCGYVDAIPPGFTVSTLMVVGNSGITDTAHRWGAALQLHAGVGPKLADPSSTTLTYWTDNGAYYDWYAYEPDITSKGVPEEVLIALAQSFGNGTYLGPPIPVRGYMLDAYWMYNERPNGNCKVNDSAWPEPFPGGLQYLATALGAPLTIYNGPQCANTTYAGVWPLVYSVFWDQGWGSGVLSQVTANASAAFYAALFASLKAQGMTTFTQDFLDFHALLFPEYLTDPQGNGGWMAGQAQAALGAGVPVQYCMALPSDILESVNHPAVTNARASNDYGAGGDNWRIAFSSLLTSALGLRASKDNFWTSCCGDRGGETSPYLVAVVATMSTGPVGLGDALFATNPAVVWPTCTLSGTLLQPSRPATAVEAQFMRTGPLANGDVRLTHTAVPTSGSARGGELYHYAVLAAGWTPPSGSSGGLPIAITADDLWPQPSASQLQAGHVVWCHNASACVNDGSDAAACLTQLGSNTTAAAPPPSPPDATTWQLAYVSPVLDGYSLLGEVSKYLAVSVARFASVAPANGGGLNVTVRGDVGEAVTLAYARLPNAPSPIGGTIATVTLTFTAGDGGVLNAVLT